MRQLSSLCMYMDLTHLASASPTFPLGLIFFVSSIFTIGCLGLFLVCFAMVTYIVQLHSPIDSVLLSLPKISSSMWKSSLTSILPCCSCCCYVAIHCKMWVGVLGCTICEYSNWKVLLLKPLGTTMVLF